ncbi:MAG TPA: recombinase family protein [Isosphaeraceae bacterium]|nr:recombinase family protein [Isosphaeraceae bacterium]
MITDRAPGERRDPVGFGSEKIGRRHHERSAIVYIRQSTPHQVLQHRESTELQYQLVERAKDLGWAANQVFVIDDDQGISGSGSEARPGFQRLLAEVGGDRVGLVLGLEMSRLARSCKDWYHLLEICGLFGTLLADQDGLYDPGLYNDRLLLGLKGTMSEAELYLLKSRMLQGKLNKARRGEIFSHPPIGYIRDAYQGIAMDPDEQVQHVVRLIFAKYAELGTVTASVRYLRQQGILLGIRPHYGEDRGKLVWREACSGTVRNVLRHPIYAGAYVYGRFQTDPRRKALGESKTGRWEADPSEWKVLIKDHLPAYITWEQYEQNRRRLTQNRLRAAAIGPPREGAALLVGLLRCARCGGRMSASYGGPKRDYRYSCDKNRLKNGGRGCQGIGGTAVDRIIAEQLLAALTPAGLELCCRAAEELERGRAGVHRYWEQRLRRARYEAQVSQRRYEAVDPMNRLVAQSLENQWEAALRGLQEQEEAHALFLAEQPAYLSAEERTTVLSLAGRFPELWQAETTSPSDRKEIVRLLIEGAELSMSPGSERFEVRIRWKGGVETRHEGRRRVHGYDQLYNYEEMSERALELRRDGHSRCRTAELLDAEGFRRPSDGGAFTAEAVTALLSRRPESLGYHKRTSHACHLRAGERWLSDLAVDLEMPYASLHAWVRRGWLRARKVEEAAGMVAVTADAEEMSRLRQLRDHRREYPHYSPPAELTTPRPKTSRPRRTQN